MRGLPPGAKATPFSIFVVNEPLAAKEAVIAPWFGQPGLGIQYELPEGVGELMRKGIITRLFHL